MAWEALGANPFAETPPSEVSAEAPSWLGRRWADVSNAFTGEGRTEFPDMPEFAKALSDAGGSADVARMLASLSPDPNAQVDILKKRVPGLESKQDKFGNVLLKTPEMPDWSYLNKPGLSKQDAQDLFVSGVVTAPFLGGAASGATRLAQVARGALGMGGASVAQDVGAMAAGSEQGVDTGRAAEMAALGGAAPLVVPAVTGLIGAGRGLYEGVASPIRGAINPRAEAFREVEGAFARDMTRGQAPIVTPAEAAQAQAAGQDLRVMDYGGETVRDLARNAADVSSTARDAMMRVIVPRFETQAGRAGELVTNDMGFQRSAAQAAADLRQQATAARSPLYEQAYRDGREGVDTPVMQQLATSDVFALAMRRAEGRVRDRAAVPGMFTTGADGLFGTKTLEYWDQVKRVLGDLESKARRAGSGERAALIGNQRRALVAELDREVPSYPIARGTAATFFGVDDAAEAGTAFAKRGEESLGAGYNMADARQAIQAMTPPERNLFHENFAAEKLRQIRRMTDRTSILNRIGHSPADRDYWRAGVGNANADRLEAFLRIEDMMDRARTAMGNSITARRLMQLSQKYGIDAVGPAMSGLGYAMADPVAFIIGAITFGGRLAQNHVNRAVMDEIGHLLVSRDPSLFQRGLNRAANRPVLDALRAFDNWMTDNGFTRALMVQEAAKQQGAAKPPETSTPAPTFPRRVEAGPGAASVRDAITRGVSREDIVRRLNEAGITPPPGF